MLVPLALFAIGQVLDPPALPIGSYKLPVLGGWREMITGPIEKPNEFFGFYAQYGASFNSLGNMRIKNPDYYESQRVGYMDWSVGRYPHNGKDAFLLQSDGDYKQSMKLTKYHDLHFDNKSKLSYWIGADGTLLQENMVINVSAGTWIMQANFNKDSYDLYLKDPFKGERRVTINPGCGIDKLNALFTPMLKDGKVTLQEKEFYMLDPLTGAPVKYTAKYSSKWAGKVFDNKESHGVSFDIDGPTHQRVYLTEDGTLYRVDTPDMHYLTIEEKPGNFAKSIGG